MIKTITIDQARQRFEDLVRLKKEKSEFIKQYENDLENIEVWFVADLDDIYKDIIDNTNDRN